MIRCLDAMQDAMARVDPWHREVRTPNHGRLFLPELLRQVRLNRGFLLVAEVEDETVGVAAGWQQKFSHLQRTTELPTRAGYLSDLSVLPPWRGKGIGTRLLRETESRFRQSGCDRIALHVFFPNKEAQRLYFRQGYSGRGLILAKQLGAPRKRWPRESKRGRKRFR